MTKGRNGKNTEVFQYQEIYDTLSENTVPALLPYHSLTGCDTTSYFFGKSKQATWCKIQQHYKLLATLGEGELTDLKLHDADNFVCQMYNFDQGNTTDEVRSTALFFKASKPDPIPKACLDVTHCTCRIGCRTFRCSCKNARMSCTIVFACKEVIDSQYANC